MAKRKYQRQEKETSKERVKDAAHCNQRLRLAKNPPILFYFFVCDAMVPELKKTSAFSFLIVEKKRILSIWKCNFQIFFCAGCCPPFFFSTPQEPKEDSPIWSKLKPPPLSDSRLPFLFTKWKKKIQNLLSSLDWQPFFLVFSQSPPHNYNFVYGFYSQLNYMWLPAEAWTAWGSSCSCVFMHVGMRKRVQELETGSRLSVGGELFVLWSFVGAELELEAGCSGMGMCMKGGDECADWSGRCRSWTAGLRQ